MADAMISVLLDQLASITREQVEKKVRLVNGVDNGVGNLRRNLETITMVLTDAEMKQFQDPALKRWLDELKDVSHDMDSVLDAWNTALCTSETMEEEEEAEVKVRFFDTLFSCFDCSKLSPKVITHRLRIAKEIQSLNQKIDEITLTKDRFELRRTSGDAVQLKRPDYTTSFLDVPVIYGQNNYKEILVNRLRLSGSNQDDKGPKFIAIVGMGGIGKTTLARNAYNDPEVKSLFENNMIWVCVSDPFDIGRIAKEIIEQLTCQTPTVIGLESLIKKIRESIEGKKFLLVLDDVWTNDYSKWLSLEQVLKLGAIGSRVVVTTRNEEVAKMIGDATMISVNKLSEEDCWLLLREIALSNRADQVRKDVDGIGRKIARKCNGLPLAVKTLGSLLRVKDIEDWHEILTSEIWELKNVEVELFNPLLLSYYDLTSIERRCFLYCAIFPKDTVLERDDLIQQWVAQGYFMSRNNNQREFEQIGQVCFQNLAMRSFFQDFNEKNDYYNGDFIVECKMHDIVHDFAQYLTKNEYSIELVSGTARRKRVDLDIRHLNLINLSSSGIPTFSNLNKKNLRTFMVKCDPMCGVLLKLLDLRYLRTLILKGGSMILPTNIGDLIHLRYISIESGSIINVPRTIGNLFNLQTLKFLSEIKELPEEVGKLINLRHLCLSQGNFESMPKFIGNLTSLQTLDYHQRGLSLRKHHMIIMEIRDFQNLNRLRKIWLEGLGGEEHKEEAKEAQLHNKIALVHLHLKFGYSMETHEIVLETLRPHENLKSLTIEQYSGGSINPSWMMSLINLRRLDLLFCDKHETLPPLGKLPSLEWLSIFCSSGLKKMGPEFLGVEMNNNTSAAAAAAESLFPKLKQLKITSAWELKEWIGVAGWKTNERDPFKIMPSLQSLEISLCHMLETLPDFLESTPLKNLKIDSCKILEKSCEGETGKEWPKIRHVPNIIITN